MSEPAAFPEVPTPPPSRGKSRLGIAAAAVVLVLAIAAGAVLYGMGGAPDKQAVADAVDCAPAKATVKRLEALAQGQVAALTIDPVPKRLTDVSFEGAANEQKKLSDFRGRTILLNLWATWCIPCRQEMPSLDRLQAKLGGPDFEVVAVSVDTARLDKRKPFLDSVGVQSLGFYADPSADILQTLKQSGKIFGLPTSFLIDSKGCELGSIAGPAAWDSDDATRLISAALVR